MTARVALPSRVFTLALLVGSGCPTGEGTNPSADGEASTDGPGSSGDDAQDESATQPESEGGDTSDDHASTSGGSTESSADDANDGSSGDDTTGSPCEPQTETCDGIDEDCDGVLDNGNPDGGEPCETGMPGVCAAGETACTDGAIACVPSARSTAELCDGLDNDCDDAIDEDDPEGGTACMTGAFGVCSAGVEHCQRGAIACVQDVEPGDEVCDGLDNDCDDAIDEDNPGGGAPCDTRLSGICAPGTQTCVEGSVQCVQNEGPGFAEICGNDLDDDCDGGIDEDCGCEHDLCTSGTPLVNGCHPCATQICAVDPFCCSNAWDGLCVGHVATVCLSAICLSPSCAHPLCDSGAALANGCHSCVTQICGADPFCCSTAWDEICANEVGSVCGLTC